MPLSCRHYWSERWSVGSRRVIWMEAVTLQMVSKTHSADSPGWMMVSTGWSFGRHTQEGVRWSGTQMSLSVLGRGRLFTVPASLFFKQTHSTALSVWCFRIFFLYYILQYNLIKMLISLLCFNFFTFFSIKKLNSFVCVSTHTKLFQYIFQRL